MPTQPEHHLKPSPEAEAIFRRWLAHLNDEFTRHTSVDRRSEIVRDELFQIYLGRPHGGKINATLTSEMATSVADESFDSRNVTLAAEYTQDLDAEQYSARKPLIYLWQMFDRSPLGLNLWLGFRLRCMLGKHIFQQLGKGVKIYPNVSFYYGYTLTIEDDCVLGENVQLDDRKPLTVPSGSNIPAFAVFGSQTRGREGEPHASRAE